LKKNWSLTLLLLTLSLGCIDVIAQEKQRMDENKGIIGEYYVDDLPVIVKLVNELPNKSTIEKLPFLTVVSWKYDGSANNGMPPAEINERMIVLEDSLVSSISKSNKFLHAYSRTGNNLKEFLYYSTSQVEFMNMLNKTLEKHDVYPIEINFYEDPTWSEFKKLLSDFN